MFSLLWLGCEDVPTKYTVTFNSGGGTAIASQSIKKGGTVTKTRRTYQKRPCIWGWYADSGLTQVYDFGSTVTSDITLYAKWNPVMYRVTFDSQGGTAIAAQTVSKDGTVIKPTDPTRQDYVFGGWYADSGLTQVYDFASTVTSDITLYAKWTPFPTSFTIAAAGGASALGTSATLQFSITNVKPAGADERVRWSVEGGSGNGSIDATGLYKTPTTIPTPVQVTIKATAVSATDVTRTYSLTIADNPNLKVIPDANFRAVLKARIPDAFVRDRLDIIHKKVTGRTALNVSGFSIASMEGIQYFIALRRMDCNGNRLTSLDVSKNTALTRLSCNDNILTSLDIRGMRSVSSLDINAGSNGKNPLATLKLHDDIKQHAEIKEAKPIEVPI